MTATTTIDDLCRAVQEAKEAEVAATARRRDLEDRLVAAIAGGKASKTVDVGQYKITYSPSVSRKVDTQLIQEIAAAHGTTDHLSTVLRWSAEVSKKQWDAADPAITGPLLAAITTKPQRASITVTSKD